MDNENDELTLRAIIIVGIKKFAGEIIGVVLLACFLWAFPGFRSLFMDHTFPAIVKDESHEQEEEHPFSMSDNDFMKLCRSGRAEKVEDAVTKGADVNAKDNEGRTVLMQAAQNGHTRTAEVLLKHGANVNAKDNNGKTALMRAVFSGRTRTAEILLKHGADVNAKDNDGWTALRWSVRHKDTAALLRRYGAKE